MIKEIKACGLGANDKQVTIVKWCFSHGAEVKKGDCIAILETAKASFELEAIADGIFFQCFGKKQKVEINETIAIIVIGRESMAQQIFNEWKEEKVKGIESKQNIYEKEGIKLTKLALKFALENNIPPNMLTKGKILTKKDLLGLKIPECSTIYPAHLDVRSLNPPPDEQGFSFDVLIYYAGNGALTIKETIESMGGYRVLGFVDVVGEKKTHGGLPVFSLDQYEKMDNLSRIYFFMSAVTERKERFDSIQEALNRDFLPFNAIHDKAYVSPTAKLGVCNHIKAGAIVDSYCRVGMGCIIDNNVTMAHHNMIGNAVHLAPGVTMGSSIRIGDYSLIGIGAAINTGVTIGENVIVSPGSVVMSDLPDNVIAGGFPAQIIGERK